MYKKLLLIAVIVGLVVGASVLSIQHYNKYQTKTARLAQVEAETQAQTAAKEKAAAEAKQARVFEVYSKVRVECEKGMGLAVYVPNHLKSKIQVPTNCGPAVIN